MNPEGLDVVPVS